jgi:hypothetical protein
MLNGTIHRLAQNHDPAMTTSVALVSWPMTPVAAFSLSPNRSFIYGTESSLFETTKLQSMASTSIFVSYQG